ncbi:MAG: SDR family oxidoreductase [Chloroflexi bacterium]|nr:SDR family oxidoreductase [Chloroflexota bacterium]
MSEQPLQGKVAIVTGAGSTIGLGRAMTLALVKAGARVAMVDIDGASLEQSAIDARAVGGQDCVTTIIGDVTKPEDGERIVADTIAKLGKLDILVNNAGVNPRITAEPGRPAFTQIPVNDWVRTISVNINGPFFMARAAALPMLEQGWGRIIGVTTSLDTMFRGAPYGLTKAAHEAFISAMALQLEGTGVTANVLIPGRSVATNMTGGARPPGAEDNRLQPEVMQRPVVWLASPASDGFNNHRVVAEFWDEELPIEERLAKASAPAAWPQLGRQNAPTR